jgi:DNA-binding MarR family transcriptional regulator
VDNNATPTPEQAEEIRWLDHVELDAWIPFSAMLMALLSALDAQLERDAGLSLFAYTAMAGLSEAPERTLPMSELAVLANGSLSRLSHAVSSLERRGWVRRSPCPDNARITHATLTDAGYQKVLATAPGHVETVRRLVLDSITPDQLHTLGALSQQVLGSLGHPGGGVVASERRHVTTHQRRSPGAGRISLHKA